VTEPGTLESDTPLRSVNADDLKRVWGLIRKVIADHGVGGIAAEMIAQHCEPDADVVAVFFRAALLQYLFREGLLDDWRVGDEPTDAVFRVGAIFPMDAGVQGFDPAAFIEHLRHPEP
jgi:hypothetical protein